ncbi:MAG: hypothetical protein ACREUQ_07415 [Burkholderiales bacterium]
MDEFGSWDFGSWDFFDGGGSVGWDSWELSFPETDYWPVADMGDFDMGGVGGVFETTQADVALDTFDGTYYSAGEDFAYSQQIENVAPLDYGVSFDPSYGIPDDAANLPNWSGPSFNDVVKAGTSGYGLTQSGSVSKPATGNVNTSKVQPSTNASSFQSIIAGVSNAIRSVGNTIANVEDTAARIKNDGKGTNTSRGTAAGIVGPRTVAHTKQGNTPAQGVSMSPVMLAVAAVAGLLIFKAVG